MFLHQIYISLYIIKSKMTAISNLKERWTFLVDELTRQFSEGDTLNLDGIIYLIGVQELGQGQRTFKKDEKLNLMHIAICTILVPYGYYKFERVDEDGWPHFLTVENLPALDDKQQQHLMKEAMLDYFIANGIYTEELNSI